ncbi:MAG: NUDIX domain-containing protein [Patescibacteria group bacterium]
MEDKRQFVVVIALIQNVEGKILLQKRLDPLVLDAHEKWEFPGGRVDYGENPEDAIRRECREEIGCEIKIKRLMPSIQSAVWTRTDDKEQHAIIVCYEAELIGGDPRPLDKKVAEVKWFTRAEISRIDTLKGIKEYVELSGE